MSAVLIYLPFGKIPQAKILRLGVATLGILLPALLLLGLLGAGSYLWFGSPQAALAYLRGEKVAVSPSLVNVGTGQPGETLEAAVEVTNWTGQPVKLIGGTFDCSCTVLEDLPVTLQPQESANLRIQISLPPSEGIFTRKGFLRTDCEEQPAVLFKITGFSRQGSDNTGDGF